MLTNIQKLYNLPYKNCLIYHIHIQKYSNKNNSHQNYT